MVTGGLLVIIVVVVFDFFFNVVEVVLIEDDFHESRQSGRRDLNPRPQRPERCALTRLRYAPLKNWGEWIRTTTTESRVPRPTS